MDHLISNIAGVRLETKRLMELNVHAYEGILLRTYKEVRRVRRLSASLRCNRHVNKI